MPREYNLSNHIIGLPSSCRWILQGPEDIVLALMTCKTADNLQKEGGTAVKLPWRAKTRLFFFEVFGPFRGSGPVPKASRRPDIELPA